MTTSPTKAGVPEPTRDRPAEEPGGCECMNCGFIFIGAEWHDKCAVCAATAAAQGGES